ncbi:MAG: 1-phosphofructokinase family hexose kinase [Deltaproteobacteria bacterium]|nr:1-phosphofructokinase family hexose kinase [Deltaproteobacteria bacterium]
MKTIVTLTMNPAIDKSSKVDHVIAERKLYCQTPCFEPGGGGINVTRAIKKLGGESIAFYLSGGPTGEMLQYLFKQENLDHRPILFDGWTRENLIVLEESTGQQYRFGMPGPPISEPEWQQCLHELSAFGHRIDFIVASGSLPQGVPDSFYASVARIGKSRGARVIVDASGEALRLALNEGVYLIKPNIREFRELSGAGLEDNLEIEHMAMDIARKGKCGVVVVSLGAAGVLMASDDGHEYIQPPPVPIISKVGAGDSMVAGIVLSLARGNPPRDAVRFGVAAGTAAVMTSGTELCRREDTERLYRQLTLKSA